MCGSLPGLDSRTRPRITSPGTAGLPPPPCRGRRCRMRLSTRVGNHCCRRESSPALCRN
ncbi:hypothetical protein ASZ90_001842 [hydrocarbon metagenome]|uniref:Uncharacterized protein n=1 Tax=hydrocarbon metagenome TaxID=938273 RepID=A0A0W8G5F3_9ZZZZ